MPLKVSNNGGIKAALFFYFLFSLKAKSDGIVGAETLATLGALNLVLSIADLPSKDEAREHHRPPYGEETHQSLLSWVLN